MIQHGSVPHRMSDGEKKEGLDWDKVGRTGPEEQYPIRGIENLQAGSLDTILLVGRRPESARNELRGNRWMGIGQHIPFF